jgi:hypothetical protein
MSTEEQLIESLRQTIAVQNDLISHLKSRIDDLKASQTIISPITAPNPPIGTQPLSINPSPFIEPFAPSAFYPYGPGQPFFPPVVPWYGDVIISISETVTIPTEGTSLPTEFTSCTH